jgi:hypothetical protein
VVEEIALTKQSGQREEAVAGPSATGKKAAEA